MEAMKAMIQSNEEENELYSDLSPFRLSLRIKNFENEKEEIKFIKNCESGIRRSIEYKLWREYIVDILRMNSCAITKEDISEVPMDVHHHLPSMFLIVKGMIRKYIEEEKEFCSFDIMSEVIELHFKNKLGYVTLISSMHSKFHNGALQIPIQLIKGDYRWFLDNYLKYLDEIDVEIINERLSFSIEDFKYQWQANEYPGISSELKSKLEN